MEGLVLEVAGSRVVLSREQALLLRDTAAANAGRASRARDLSLLLERALSQQRPLVLRYAEARTLAQLAREAGLEEIAAAVSRTSS